MRRILTAAAAIVAAFILQNNLLRQIPLIDAAPNLFLAVTAAYGLTAGKRAGMAVGLFCGILTDTFNGDGGLGFYMLAYLYIGAFCGLFFGYIDPEEQVFPLTVTGICSLGFGFYVYLFRFLIRGRFEWFAYVTETILPEAACTVLAAILVYPLLSRTDRYLALNKKRRTSSFV